MATQGDFRARFAAALNEAKTDTLEVKLGGESLGNILKNPNHFLVTTQFPVKCRFEKCDACFFVKRY